MNTALTYDDVNIVPGYSDIDHRNDIDLKSKLTNKIILDVPVISSPMDTVTGYEMLVAMNDNGGMGFLHRFQSLAEILNTISQFLVNHPNGKIGVSVGVTDNYREVAKEAIKLGVKVILIDVANGHHRLVKNAISEILSINDKIDIIAGNIATGEAAEDLISWGATGLRCGIGGGSMCSTRIQSGVGVPMISCLQEISQAVSQKGVRQTPIIADGGIRHIGDIAKAIAAGANTVMLGSMLAGTKETPGRITKTGIFPNEILYKQYRGSASLESKLDRGETSNVEGYSTTILYKGKVKRIMDAVKDGVRSSMSYVGAKNMEKFKSKAKLVRVSQASTIEAMPHGLLNKN